MPPIGFYHLTRTALAPALAALLGRTLAAGEKALVLCADEARVAALDEALWTAPNPDWLPHGTAATPHPEWQPVFLTAEEQNPAGAKYLFLTGGTAPANPAAYTRIFDLFDGNNEAETAAARTRWTTAKAAGHEMTYWKQGDAGWQKAG
jgi:DNA polymerase-3 subunit chi